MAQALSSGTIAAMVASVGANVGVRPVSRPISSHHSSMLVTSSPPQLTMVAGADASVRRYGSERIMSSLWIGA